MADLSANDLQNSKAFLGLNPNDQTRFLQAHSPAFSGLNPEDQANFLAHVTKAPMADQPKELPKNYGFTPGNMLSNFGEGVKGLVKGAYGVGEDLVNNPNWFTGKDSTLNKFAIQPAEEEVRKAGKDFSSGNKMSGYGHVLASAVPLVGPWAAKLGEQAGTGDVGGAVANAAGTVAPLEAIGPVTRAAKDVPVGRVLRTAGNMVLNTDITKPFSLVKDAPKYWRESSPLGRMISRTNEAVAEGRAAPLPTRVTDQAPIDPVAQAIKERRAAPIPVRIPPERAAPSPLSQAVSEGRASKIRTRVSTPLPADPAEVAATETMNRSLRSNPSALGTIGTPAESPTALGRMNASLKSNPSALGSIPTPPAQAIDAASGLAQGPEAPPQASELQYRPLPADRLVQMKNFEKSTPSALGKIGTRETRPIGKSVPDSPTFIPEPRPGFGGENEGYMASVPREELHDLARSRKPGAGKQLQQLGKPIIYIPKEADF